MSLHPVPPLTSSPLVNQHFQAPELRIFFSTAQTIARRVFSSFFLTFAGGWTRAASFPEDVRHPSAEYIPLCCQLPLACSPTGERDTSRFTPQGSAEGEGLLLIHLIPEGIMRTDAEPRASRSHRHCLKKNTRGRFGEEAEPKAANLGAGCSLGGGGGATASERSRGRAVPETGSTAPPRDTKTESRPVI